MDRSAAVKIKSFKSFESLNAIGQLGFSLLEVLIVSGLSLIIIFSGSIWLMQSQSHLNGMNSSTDLVREFRVNSFSQASCTAMLIPNQAFDLTRASAAKSSVANGNSGLPIRFQMPSGDTLESNPNVRLTTFNLLTVTTLKVFEATESGVDISGLRVFRTSLIAGLATNGMGGVFSFRRLVASLYLLVDQNDIIQGCSGKDPSEGSLSSLHSNLCTSMGGTFDAVTQTCIGASAQTFSTCACPLGYQCFGHSSIPTGFAARDGTGTIRVCQADGSWQPPSNLVNP